MIHNLDCNLHNFEMYFREYSDWNKQGRCWPNGSPKQDCIVVPPPSNIMEVKKQKQQKNTYYRGQNRTLIKYKSK